MIHRLRAAGGAAPAAVEVEPEVVVMLRACWAGRPNGESLLMLVL
jgi:hypothetical protein